MLAAGQFQDQHLVECGNGLEVEASQLLYGGGLGLIDAPLHLSALPTGQRARTETLHAAALREGPGWAGKVDSLETTVIDAPFFEKRIEIVEFEKQMEEFSGRFKITKARLVEK